VTGLSPVGDVSCPTHYKNCAAELSLLQQSFIAGISLLIWLAVSAALFLLIVLAKRCVAVTVAYQQKKKELKENVKKGV
jgi:hypothetical protein